MDVADHCRHLVQSFLRVIFKIKFFQVGHALRFVVNIIRNFQFTMNTEDSLIIPPNLFSEDKPLVLIDIPFCKKNFFDFIKTSTIS